MKCKLLKWIEGDDELLGVVELLDRVYIISAKHVETLHNIQNAKESFPERSMIEFKQWVFTILKREYLRASYYLE